MLTDGHLEPPKRSINAILYTPKTFIPHCHHLLVRCRYETRNRWYRAVI